MKDLVLSNFDPLVDLIIFTNDRGSWNVSRALRDCKAGKHKAYTLDVAEAYRANRKAEADDAKVRRFMRTPDVFNEPLLGVIEDGAMWLIDGQHRLRAMHRMKIRDFVAFVIEESDAAHYRILYNGERKPPFKI